MTRTLPPRAVQLAAIAVMATIAVIAMGGCGRRAEPDSAAALAPASVTVVRAGATASGALVLPARVSARDEVTLTARIAARLTQLPLREGDRFARGRTLAEFDAPETRAALDGARAGLAAASAARDMARRQESRMDSLYANRVAALHELEGAQTERRAAEAAWAQASAQFDQLRSAVRLDAPFDGVVVRRHADPGATMGPGQPVLDIRSSEAGEITVSVPESELARLAGGRGEAQVGDGPWFGTRLTRVDGMTDVATRSRVARFRPAAPMTLESGAFARVRLAAIERLSARAAAATASLSVPTSALVRRGALTGVFVAEDGVARLRWLRVGRESAGSIEVLAGLDPADAVIVSPAGLSDGRPVKAAS